MGYKERLTTERMFTMERDPIEGTHHKVDDGKAMKRDLNTAINGEKKWLSDYGIEEDHRFLLPNQPMVLNMHNPVSVFSEEQHKAEEAA